MKRLFIIGGTMGIGKSTVSQILKQKLPNSVFLDGDWCWDSSPFQVTAETKEMVLQNICAVLNNFLKCSAYENVIFCWVMHEQSIIDTIISCLDTADCRIIAVSLICSEQELVERLRKDVTAGIRTPDVIERSVQRIPLYQKLNTIKVNTSGKNAAGRGARDRCTIRTLQRLRSPRDRFSMSRHIAGFCVAASACNTFAILSAAVSLLPCLKKPDTTRTELPMRISVTQSGRRGLVRVICLLSAIGYSFHSFIRFFSRSSLACAVFPSEIAARKTDGAHISSSRS